MYQDVLGMIFGKKNIDRKQKKRQKTPKIRMYQDVSQCIGMYRVWFLVQKTKPIHPDTS